jgi:hypothetical protein
MSPDSGYQQNSHRKDVKTNPSGSSFDSRTVRA